MKIDFSVRQWIIAALSVLLVLYILFQARFIIFGPQISIESPSDAEVLGSAVIMARGHASNISMITLNDRRIFTDERGAWEEKLLASPGVSIMTVRVRDRFGRENEKSVRVIYNP
ncbi:MAG: hypothetical protein A3J09_02825 [Candidatus Zambryskibacteria bacterium RIFCSPLOWO2_02_FULL_51_21]|uniref:Uncharacterized protein n=1 Tax=Candidatus Zambryskibacteria bacterium RIFCSPHIGHO2_02_FULL_43_37 TaxID=1802749 RepID=A0A1G2TG57_9BACT|nr:MAG: hypothetical protein A2723_02815 [Candidatus Zambryskibacteria bacterium RIFCSPHIGHO2_01_FULL_52_18]OHA96287.1 MAG: hypothetical protein A3D49_00075 [Candidatus Zambryskibacteria bacterium RIFCSPHIGHO2_02_FULL_43_37]OHB11454.1 MAG: hypothetical protein A3J09_02825 [Candidatus Zambryskibacteria bacterium RIFCSPLOWO2_02_FULL_51_21]